MKKLYRLKFLLALCAVISMYRVPVKAQSNIFYLDHNPDIVWKIKPEADIKDPNTINKLGAPTNDWITAIVPGTVFNSYVVAKQEKDPNFGDNIYKVDRAQYDRNFWYRTEFSVPANYVKGKTWLNFRGVNRKADIYLNNKKLGTLNGFMQQGHFDITDIASKTQKNVLTVLVYWPKPPLVNFQSPTYISSDGWDWMPSVPGLNMGITDKVYLTNTNDLTISEPWIRSNLVSKKRAELSVNLKIKNNSNKPQQSLLSGTIMPGNIRFSQTIRIAPGKEADVKLDKEKFKQLIVQNPSLWWPNGNGAPNLYTCKLSVGTNKEISDTKLITFGIKKYTYDTVGHVLHFYVNGTKIFIRGGNWGMSEYMLRCRGNEYDTKVKLHKEMNFNMIRNWIGSTTDDEFYEACDKYGIMVWDDFWLNSNNNLPYDVENFNVNAIEKIKRLRNHPSIALWCGDNEGSPNGPLNGWLADAVKKYDGDERRYQPNSHAGSLSGSGPWGNADPRWYFTKSPDGYGGNKGWGMRSEVGTAVFTNFDSFKKFMPEDKWWPRNEMWNLHFFGPAGGNASPDRYEVAVNQRYGQASGIQDFCRKAQLLNIETNKAMYEGWLDNIWNDASGILTWMSQSAYPSLVWQTYDYYHDLNGAYWGAKKACEPVHILWNALNSDVKVVNTSGQTLPSLTAEATVYNIDGQVAKNHSASVVINAVNNASTKCFTLNFAEVEENLAKGKPIFASSTDEGKPEMVADNNPTTRWGSQSRDNQWIYIDLQQEQTFDAVGLNWETACAKAYKIQVSNDAKEWKDVYSTTNGRPGEKRITFDEVKARYVRMLGIQRNTVWGYSLWDFEVYRGKPKNNGLTNVHFIKLKLKDKTGKVISDNFYWRGNKRTDFTELNDLKTVDLKVSAKTTQRDGKYYIAATITNPASSKAVAFAIRAIPVKKSNGEQILPALMNDNYFTLLKGETKQINISFDAEALGNDTPTLSVVPYNNFVVNK